MPLLQCPGPAPDFATHAVVNGNIGHIALKDYQGEKYVCIIFYPMDFVYAESIIPFSNRWEQKCQILLGAILIMIPFQNWRLRQAQLPGYGHVHRLCLLTQGICEGVQVSVIIPYLFFQFSYIPWNLNFCIVWIACWFYQSNRVGGNKEAVNILLI